MGFICKPWNRLSLFTRIMIGFVLGIILGIVLGPRAEILKPLGTILTNLLTMVVAPLVFTLLVCAAATANGWDGSASKQSSSSWSARPWPLSWGW